MFITDKKLKEMIGKVLKEVAYTEPFSGNLAYFIVNFLAADRLKKYIRNRKTRRDPMSRPAVHSFNFTKNFEDHLRKEGRSFLPLSTKERAFPSGRPVAVSMFDNHHNNLKNAFNYIKKILETDLGTQFAKRSKQKMLDQWSGLLYVRIIEGDDESRLEGAAFNTQDSSLNLTITLNKGFMTSTLRLGLERPYRDYNNLMREIKNTMVHELVHARQSETGFKEKELLPGENEIQKHVRTNYFGYSDVDKSIFPKIGQLQDYLKKRIVDFYDDIVAAHGVDTAYDAFFDMRERGPRGPLSSAKIYEMYYYSRIIAQLFSPEEVEAYVRGYRAESKSQEYGVGFTKKDGGADNFYQQVEKNIREKLYSRFNEFLYSGIQEMNVNNERYAPDFTLDQYKEDMVEGYMKVYKSIFG